MTSPPELEPPGDEAPPRPRTLRRLLGTLLALVAFAFLFGAVARDWQRLQAYDWSVRPLLLAASLALLLLGFGYGVWLWLLVLRRLGSVEVSFGQLLRIWFLSNLARYIPGKIWQFVGAAGLARAAALPAPLVLISLAVNMGFSVLGAAVVGLATLGAVGIVAPWVAPTATAAALAFSIVVVHPGVLNALLRLLPQRLRGASVAWRGSWSAGMGLVVLAVGLWLEAGLAFWAFVLSLTPVGVASFAALISVNALAFLAGYLVFIVPAGLGARELSMAALLTPVLPAGAGVAAVVAIASRLWFVTAELIGAAGVAALRR